MICNCNLAGTNACKTCVNNKDPWNEYDYNKWFHVDIPEPSKEELDKWFSSYKFPTISTDDIKPKAKEVQDLNCGNCKYYHRDIVKGIEFVNHNYCEKGVNVASLAFWCKWGREIKYE